ncbi:MAG: hypothetical protein AB7L84_06960 [Acidimicrobiia bacterium]
MLAAQVWHFWIAAILTPVVVLTLVATIVGYLRKTQSPRYPRSE